MSCLSFLAPLQREALQASTRQGAPLSSFASPEVSAGKLARIRSMATHASPGIRESAALSYHAPHDVLDALAHDPDTGVRCCVARNPRTPAATLGFLVGDASAGVRGWVAAHPSTPAEALDALADDPSSTVRSLVAWTRRWPRPHGGVPRDASDAPSEVF